MKGFGFPSPPSKSPTVLSMPRWDLASSHTALDRGAAGGQGAEGVHPGDEAPGTGGGGGGGQGRFEPFLQPTSKPVRNAVFFGAEPEQTLKEYKTSTESHGGSRKLVVPSPIFTVCMIPYFHCGHTSNCHQQMMLTSHCSEKTHGTLLIHSAVITVGRPRPHMYSPGPLDGSNLQGESLQFKWRK